MGVYEWERSESFNLIRELFFMINKSKGNKVNYNSL